MVMNRNDWRDEWERAGDWENTIDGTEEYHQWYRRIPLLVHEYGGSW